MRHLLVALALIACSFGAQAQFRPEKLSPIGEKIEVALKSDIRTPAEKERDRERRPRQTLEFFGLRDDMRVVELMPAGGWYTKILGQILADKGQLYEALGTDQIAALASQNPELARIKVVPGDAATMPAADKPGLYDLAGSSFGVKDADLVLTFRNLHNFSPAGRDKLNRMVFEALKPGGFYGVVDHSRRHNEPDNPENVRRMDPVRIIKEVEAAGFQFVDYSGLHYRPDDELRYEVSRKTVTGNTDRFTLLFRKPK